MSDSTPDAGEIISRTTLPLPPRGKTASKRPGLSITLDDDAPDPIQTPTNLSAEKDPLYISVDLPSKFYFYSGLKTLSVCPVKGSHQAKFHRAAKLESTKLTVEAVSSLLGDEVGAQWLTVPDFFWLLYYLRINFYPEGSLTYKAVCMNPTHLAQVNSGEKTQESLVTLSILKKTELKETLLSAASIEFLSSVDQTPFQALGYNLTAPRMQDSIELEEKLSERPDYDELEYLADYAGCLVRNDGEVDSLEDRIKVVSDMSVGMIKTLEAYLQVATGYGVEEFVSTKCKECGAVVETEVSVTAHDFL